MSVNVEILRPYLQAFDFKGLFAEGLGWDYGAGLRLRLRSCDYLLHAVAEKKGCVVFECVGEGSDWSTPPYPVRRRIENEVSKSAYEHLIVFTDAQRTIQIWQWVRRAPGQVPACREHRYDANQPGDRVLQRLQSISFTLEEEAKGIGIAEVTSRVAKALDVEKVTKRFYQRFKQELIEFGSFVDGIAEQADRDWYASLMLNRMMFVYFIQKKGFLDGDENYLKNRLRRVRRERGGGRFQQFYRLFLLRLFHEGLGKPESERAPDLAALLGQVPFLNGGLFDVHDLEGDNSEISIPDEAFERVFGFFDSYSWHLDERPRQADNEINPDVLGYIFEKYVNQKQMGAYYTKEDITGYISRNTIIPFLFDTARKACRVAFVPDGGVWRLLRDDPDAYIYPAVAHGIAFNANDHLKPASLIEPFELPPEIEAGIPDVSRRGGWNEPAPSDYALPTETWREVVSRRQRHAEVRSKLAAGEVSVINDLITLNLDMERFALDVIAQSEGPELLRAFWQAICGVTVLDPTCGSGAFLFAALNVLEPLYTACLEGMRGFLDDENRMRRHGPGYLKDFKAVLAEVEKHPSERYFILKSIVLNNLFGVDIMEEAVEICKLRLFLKLVAQLDHYHQIEPLPDIDFNIRPGNTLVGFTSLSAVRDAMQVTSTGQNRLLSEDDRVMLELIEEEAQEAEHAFAEFRGQQTAPQGISISSAKRALRKKLSGLNDELDRHLAAVYGIDPDSADSFADWKGSHQPFHWFAEFYGIMQSGGFDVIIGNPPYVEYGKVRSNYTVDGHVTMKCGNLYAMVLERSFACLRGGG